MKNSKYLGQMTLAALFMFSTATMAVADNVSLGLEGFWDNYREPRNDIKLNNHAVYGSVTGDYTADLTPNYFIGVDGRASYGRDHYKSLSGSQSEIPQFEGDFRLRTGLRLSAAHGDLKPYIGIGTRVYKDDWSQRNGGYERDIDQIYAPVGMTFQYPIGSWQVAPNIEYDPLIYGHVHSQLQPYIGTNINNVQHSGYGLRGEFMVGQEKNGYGWQAGPFIRYWNIDDSNVNHGLIEPYNNRVQAGFALRLDY